MKGIYLIINHNEEANCSSNEHHTIIINRNNMEKPDTELQIFKIETLSIFKLSI